MSVIYHIVIGCYAVIIRLAALYNDKAKRWIIGRKNIFKRLSEDFRNVDKVVWFHAASLGEFEQGRPVIEAFRKEFPEHKILLTFFSPSGYEIRKDYKVADYIYYLPIDSRSNARKFLEITQPKLAVFIKYEFWFNYLDVLFQNKIPTFVISAIFREDQYFFKPYGFWFRNKLRLISQFFVQNKQSETLLHSIGISHVKLTGDTRFDRVFEIAQNVQSFPLINKFAEGSIVILGGSTWPRDEELLQQLMQGTGDQFKLIIAPHEIHSERINDIVKEFSDFKVLRYSEMNDQNIHSARVLIIDGMGFLSALYQYCAIAFIGGGFGKGIHNILEAATFGKPIFFGPNYYKFKEAVDLIHKGGALEVSNELDLIYRVNNLLSGEDSLQKASAVCKQYVHENKGATQIIMNEIDKRLRS